jgi:hypothetical protein
LAQMTGKENEDVTSTLSDQFYDKMGLSYDW